MKKKWPLPFGMKTKQLALLVAGIMWTGLTIAQESVNVSGGNATGSGGSAAYSIGQVVYTTHSGSTGTVAQGVQHAYEIFILGTKETALNISLTAFPNPATDNLTITVSEFKNEKLWYQLFDALGKSAGRGEISGQQTTLALQHLPMATYFLDIHNQENKKIQSFKIIKN